MCTITFFKIFCITRNLYSSPFFPPKFCFLRNSSVIVLLYVDIFEKKMASAEVTQLTKECLEALRLGGPRSSTTSPTGRERLEVPSDSSDSLKIIGLGDDRRSESPSTSTSGKDDDENNRQSENARHILSKLKALHDFLPMRGAPKEVYGSKGGKIVKNGTAFSLELLQQRKYFCREGYWSVLNQLVDSFDAPW